MKNDPLARRALLRRGAILGAASAIGRGWAGAVAAQDPQRRFKIGACDWSIGARASLEAFEIAREIGLDGVQISLGTPEDAMRLSRPEVQREFLDAAKRTGVAIASMAIGELNSVPFKSDERTIEWVRESIDACHALGREVVLLAFFGKNDLKNDRAGTDETVRRLAELAPKAEKAGVTLGIESWLSAEEHMGIIDRVGSPAVKVYYDVANSEKMGYDIYAEIRRLGKHGQICEIHAKENGTHLGEGRVDFAKVRAALEEIGYRGWMQIEGALPPGAPLVPAYRKNLAFLRSLFA